MDYYEDFIRIGIGISRPRCRDRGTVGSYVLGNFSSNELDVLKNDVFPKILNEHFIKGKFKPDLVPI